MVGARPQRHVVIALGDPSGACPKPGEQIGCPKPLSKSTGSQLSRNEIGFGREMSIFLQFGKCTQWNSLLMWLEVKAWVLLGPRLAACWCHLTIPKNGGHTRITEVPLTKKENYVLESCCRAVVGPLKLISVSRMARASMAHLSLGELTNLSNVHVECCSKWQSKKKLSKWCST